MTSHVKLRDLIRSVRTAKSAAEERAVVAKESALIRTAFKEEDENVRHRNVAKLLYIHMLGYPAHYGQLECLKLVASKHFVDKRVGYLGLMLLLDERQDVLMLVTNSLKNDMNSDNPYVIGMALSSLGNISSGEIARDLAPEVEKLLGSTNAYVRKKAALCAIRIFRKVPDLMENFVPRVRALFSDRNHGVLLAAVTLAIEMCLIHPSNVVEMRKYTPQVLKILTNLTRSRYEPEYDIGGLADPFLQIKCLKLLRLLGQHDKATCEQMNDTLAQVVNTTDNLRNPGNAILYECVRTIMASDVDQGVRVMGINVLGGFLANRDNNIRYVALSSLARVPASQLSAVQRHRATVIESLRDPDMSIRRRALDLLYLLIKEDNVRQTVRELLSHLDIDDGEFKAELVAKICSAVDRFSPSRRWQVDTLLQVLMQAGEYVREEVLAGLVAMIAAVPEVQAYAVTKLYLAMKKDIHKQALLQVAAWCVGEFGELLLSAPSIGEEEAPVVIDGDDVVATLSLALSRSTTTLGSREFLLTAVAKLTTRFPPQMMQALRGVLNLYKTDFEAELQTRAVEYDAVAAMPDAARQAVLERMPVLDESKIRMRARSAADDARAAGADVPSTAASDAGAAVNGGNGIAQLPTPAAAAPSSTLDDLLGLSLDDTPATTGAPPSAAIPGFAAPAPSAPAAPAAGGAGNTLDLLGDIFGGPAPAAPVMGAPVAAMGAAPPAAAPAMPTSLMDDLLGGGDSAAAAAPAAAPTAASAGVYPAITAFQQNGLTITMEFEPAGDSTNVKATFANASSDMLNNFVFQAAVPKSVKLAMNPPSGSTLTPGGGTITQTFSITNSLRGTKPVVMKIRMEYKASGVPMTLQHTVSNFPPGI